jgi:LytR cell envelope-related transcriptional attenuator
MADLIDKVGNYAGVASLFGLAVLSFLYFMQARHVRDLEDKATFVPDDIDLSTTPPVSAPTSKERKAAAAAGAPASTATEEQAEPVTELEAARQVEVARAAALRRERFEQRRGSGPFGGSGGIRGRGRPEPRAMIVIGLGVAVLLVGIVFAISKAGGGDSGTPATSNSADSLQGTGAPKEVAFLNATPVSGLAGKVSKELQGNYKAAPISNVETPFDTSVVMFDKTDPANETLAKTVGAALQITDVQPMTSEVKKASEGSTVAVVVGEDRAGT